MPATQPPLFSDEAAPPPAASTDLSLQIKAPKLAPAQLRFNKLLEKIEQLTARLAQTQAAADSFRPVYSSTLQPLQARFETSLREMVWWLDARLQKKGLTPAVLRDAKAMLCNLSQDLALAGDADMRAIHDRHSPDSLAEKEKLHAEDVRAMMQGMAGRDASELGDLGDLGEGLSAQDMLHAGMERLRQKMLQDQADREAQAQARKAAKPRSAAQQKAQAQQQDAQGTLRTIYRQLASALHPDREPDALERVRKTELMGQVNAAYERRDLMALLTLQLRFEQLDATAISRMAADKLAALSLLLKEQAAAVEAELFACSDRVQHEFGLSPFTPVTAAGLARELEAQAQGLSDDVAMMQEDLLAVQTDAGLKRWLKAQKKLSRQSDDLPDFGGFY